MTTRELLLTTWHLDPLALLCAALAIALASKPPRVEGASRARAVGGGTGRRLCMIAAVAMVAAAVASPMAALADGYLFSAHMLQHLLLVLVVPPLALLGVAPFERPSTSLRLNRLALRLNRLPWVPICWVMGLGAMWIWHAPTLCNAAASSAPVHRVQEVSLLGMGTLFWWPIFRPQISRRIEPLKGIAYLFTACVGCTLLGIAVTFSPVEVCSIFLHPADRLAVMPLLREGWGLSPERDQRIGGLLMWVPACLIYGAGILGQLARWYRPEPLPSHAPPVLEQT